MSAPEGLRVGLVVTAAGLGFRHGIDWDHIAAITDIAGSQDSTGRSLGYATCYYAGHAAVVGALGVAAIVAGRHLPSSVDTVMEHVVGATLIALGVFIVVSLARNGRDFRMRSRWMLVFRAVRRLGEWIRTPASSVALAPTVTPQAASSNHDAFASYGVVTSVSIGALHGIGAETPTQVLLLVAAGSAGGTGAGLILLGAFLFGLFGSNSVVATAAALGFLRASRNFAFYASVSVVAGAASIFVGALLFFGRSNLLPSLLGG
jgi:high-affinity nickel-transport protein